MKRGRVRWQEGGGNKKRFQYCTDPSGQVILYLRALQGHSGRNPIDPTLQDNVLITNNFLRVQLSCRMCNQFLHSITNSGLIAGRQNVFTSVVPMNKEHKDPYEIDLNAPRDVHRHFEVILARRRDQQRAVRRASGGDEPAKQLRAPKESLAGTCTGNLMSTAQRGPCSTISHFALAGGSTKKAEAALSQNG